MMEMRVPRIHATLRKDASIHRLCAMTGSTVRWTPATPPWGVQPGKTMGPVMAATLASNICDLLLGCLTIETGGNCDDGNPYYGQYDPVQGCVYSDGRALR